MKKQLLNGDFKKYPGWWSKTIQFVTCGSKSLAYNWHTIKIKVVQGLTFVGQHVSDISSEMVQFNDTIFLFCYLSSF